MKILVQKLFNFDTWKVVGASMLGTACSGYAAAREAIDAPALKLTTAYDITVARIFALALCAYMLSKLVLLWWNRNKKEEP